jgi:hypothetical protein
MRQAASEWKVGSLPTDDGGRASRRDLRSMALMLGLKHWSADDWKPELSVERARHWLPLLIKLHIPQAALLLHLQGQLFYYKDVEGKGWRDLVSTLLARRALLVIALSHAVDHDQPVKW